jgi:hypothetical protein
VASSTLQEVLSGLYVVRELHPIRRVDCPYLIEPAINTLGLRMPIIQYLLKAPLFGVLVGPVLYLELELA